MNKIKNINKKILNFLDVIFVGEYKKYSLFFTAMIDSVIAILPTDLIVAYYFLREKKASVFYQSIAIGLGSVIGGSLLYFLANEIIQIFPSILNSEYYLKIQEILKYSFWIQFFMVVFFAFTSLIPFIWLSILLGAFNFSYFIIYWPAMFLGRFLRFFLIAWLTKKYGQDVVEKISTGFWNLIYFLKRKK